MKFGVPYLALAIHILLHFPHANYYRFPQPRVDL